MTIRRAIVAAALAAVAVMPSPGNAVGEAARRVGASACEVGSSSLSFDLVASKWNGSTQLVCKDGAGAAAAQPELTLSFEVIQVQGVNTFQAPYLTGSRAFLSQVDPANPAAGAIFSCQLCAGLTATGSRPRLTPGVYALYAQATVATPSGVLERGSHTTCFVVTENSPSGVQTILAGCTP